MPALHPDQALYGGTKLPPVLPVCDHYAGTEPLMRKSLARLGAAGRRPAFDVTLDIEDGAPAGCEAEQAELIAALLTDRPAAGRVGVRLPHVHHPEFITVIQILLGKAAEQIDFFTIPKLNSANDLANAIEALDRIGEAARAPQRPVQALVETHGALRDVFRLAAHPRVEALSFGLMDFVSAHHGAIDASALSAQGQFDHPLILRAKLEIAAACHAYGKVASHNVATELDDMTQVSSVASRARHELAYQRMWSIHPRQIEPIVQAMQPSEAELGIAALIIARAAELDWAPIRVDGHLHDRASYRHFWTLLRRAHALGRELPDEALPFFDRRSS
jgi:citrate lyase subunit beta/citryl-CoA lyase